MKKSFKFLALTVLGLFASLSLNAQLTTSSISGKVTDATGAVPGAAIVATHTPSGTQYYAISNNEGLFSIPGMRPGGPYEVTVQLLGYKTVKFEDITLQLSEVYGQNVQLEPATELLDEVVVVAQSSKFANEKTGASTNISNREMMNLPNSGRSLTALTKLSPYSNGMSFAGSDGRSTNVTIDGANFNNNFGLRSELPGGGTPISLDALEEIQIVIAPFDVRQSNFLGGGINAITKSGTNTFKGTAYGYYHNEKMRGNLVGGNDLGDRKSEMIRTYGFTLGGPIIKNKLFFFVNFEKNDQPGQAITEMGTTPTSELDKIANKLKTEYGYDPGSYTDYPGGTDNMKILARLDWNINDANHLAFRFNKTNHNQWSAPNGNSCDDGMRNRSDARAGKKSRTFSNNMYFEARNVTSFALDLNSRLSDNMSNQLLATYSFIDEMRGSKSDPFPHFDIVSGYNDDGSLVNEYVTSFGYELFTYKNGVTNKVWNVTDNFTYSLGAHKITAGINFEYMFAENSYIRNGTGYYRYASIDDFLNGNVPLSFHLKYAWDSSPETDQITYYQGGAYAQDEWNVTDRFKLNYGLRLDTIIYDDSAILTNPKILAYDMGGRSIDTGKWPRTTVQVNPRIGFNWDVRGDKSLVVRGGTGMFQGRLPLVFFTNMSNTSGMVLNEVGYNATLDKTNHVTYSDEAWAKLVALNGGKTTGGKITTSVDEMKNILGLPNDIDSNTGSLPKTFNGVDPNFKMPQVWKSSLAVDYRVPVSFPLSVTAEAMYTKTIYGVRLVDWNINESKINDAIRYKGADDRYDYSNATDWKYGSSTAYVLTNTNKGYGWTGNLTVNASPVKNLDIMAAYTYTMFKEISGMPGSAASSAYSNLFTVNGPNFTGVQFSQYVIPHKFMANVGYFVPFKIFGGNGLHLNFYYTGYSPLGYSYIYDGDMNSDGLAADLIYIPKDDSEIKFKTDADKDAFWKFVAQDKYLNSHKGQYAEAYAGRSPMRHRFDARIAEDFSFRTGSVRHNFQVSVSIDNIGNMINSNWGVTRWGCYGNAETMPLLKVESVANGTPVYSVKKVGDAYPTKSFDQYNLKPVECWQLLVGLKYFFN